MNKNGLFQLDQEAWRAVLANDWEKARDHFYQLAVLCGEKAGEAPKGRAMQSQRTITVRNLDPTTSPNAKCSWCDSPAIAVQQWQTPRMRAPGFWYACRDHRAKLAAGE